MFIRVGGVPGVGKTTVIDRIVGASKQLGLPVVKVKGANYLMKALGISSLDELRRVPEEVKAAVRPQMYRWMYEEDLGDPCTVRLRDAHFSLYHDDGSVTEFPVLDDDRRQMLSMVCLVAPPAAIYQRREVDINSRSDRPLDLGLIKRELATEISIARQQANSLGFNLVEVENTGNIQQACRLVVERTLNKYDFQLELLRELSRTSSSLERLR